VGAWLAATARNEAIRTLRRSARFAPLEDDVDWPDELQPPLDARLVEAERDAALTAAFASLPERCRRLLRLLIADEGLSYEEVAAVLGVPIGTVGPTRARCLDRLRRSRELARISGPSRDSL
jgi:RNA polymerase sigma factor (sigma-70 family)